MGLMLALESTAEFKNLRPEELAGVEAVMTAKVYPDGHVFVREGEPGDALYLIVEGEVIATRRDAAGNNDILARLGPGDLFGLLALIDEGPRAATCTAFGEVVAAVLPRRRFQQLYRSQAPAAYTFQFMVARQLVRDVRAMNEALVRTMLELDEEQVHAPLADASVEYRPPAGEEVGEDDSTQ